MMRSEMPTDLRMKVRRYLEFIMESKIKAKIDEEEIFGLLNKNLRDKVQMYMKGRLVSNIGFIKKFGLDFTAELTQRYLVKHTYVIEDNIFVEGDVSQDF